MYNKAPLYKVLLPVLRKLEVYAWAGLAGWVLGMALTR